MLFAVRQPVGFGLFVGLLVGLVCAGLGLTLLIMTSGYFVLRYRFDRDALVIRWLGREEIVPFANVEGIFAGPRLGQPMRARGWNWPGYHVGVGRTRSMGLVRYYTTTSAPDDIALIVTRGVTYAVSPADPSAFRRQLIRRVEDSDPVAPGVEPRGQAWAPALRDASLPLLLVAVLALLAVSVGYIGLRWDGLPETIPLHFAADGTADQTGPREQVFRVPAIGAAIATLNLGLGMAVYARERAAARMLWTASVVVQVLVVVATARILH